mgnify:CR=1 FL=1
MTEVRHQTKLYLRIVGTEEGTAFVRYEGLTDSTAFGSTDGDVLDVGVAAGEATRGGDGLVEGRMDLTIGVDERRKGFDIGAEELLHATVVEDLAYDGVLVTELF